MTNPKFQSKKISQKLKSQILSEILLPNSSISKIAKKYDVSSTTLYCWRMDYFKKMLQDLNNNKEVSSNNLADNFVELVTEDDLLKERKLLPSGNSTSTSSNSNVLNPNPSLEVSNMISKSIN